MSTDVATAPNDPTSLLHVLDDNCFADWKDATSTIMQAASELQLGEMVHHKGFKLADAMNATEIGEPKMDTGFDSSVRTIEDALDQGLVRFDLQPTDVLRVMRRLLVAEVSFFGGVTLIQTVYQSLHMHCLEHDGLNSTLAAFGMLVIMVVRGVTDLVSFAEVCSEEDFVGNTFELPTYDHIKLDAAVAQADKAEAALEANIRDTHNKTSKDAIVLQRTLHLLRFHRFLAVALDLVLPRRRYNTAGERPDAGEASLPKIKKVLLAARDEFDQFVDLDHGAISSTDGDDRLEGEPQLGFDGRLCRLMMPVSFPSARLPSVGETKQVIKNLIASFLRTCELTRCKTITDTRESVKMLAKASPNIVGNCWIEAICRMLFDGDLVMYNLAADEALCRGCVTKQGLVQGEVTRVLFGNLALHEQALRRYYLLNKSRQWRSADHVLESWDLLTREASNADTENASLWSAAGKGNGRRDSLLTFMTSKTVDTMLRVLEVGCELDLFCGTDVHAVFWYRDYLSSLLCQMIQNQIIWEMDNQDDNSASQKRNESSNKGGGKGKKGKQKQKRSKKPERNTDKGSVPLLSLQDELDVCSAKMYLSRGVWKAISCVWSREGGAGEEDVKSSGQDSQKQQQPPPGTLSCLESRFTERFRAFEQISSPRPLTYEEYVRTTQLGPDDVAATLKECSSLFQHASALFARVKANVEKVLPTLVSQMYYDDVISDLERLVKVSKANWVSTNVMVGMIGPAKGDKMRSIAYDFGIHHAFPVVKYV